MFETREEAFELSEEVPGGETSELWESLANLLNVTIVAGICERDGSALYNSAVTIGPDGYIGTYRKVHLWGKEALFFRVRQSWLSGVYHRRWTNCLVHLL